MLADHADIGVAMVAPRRAHCGVADYTDYLSEAMQPMVTAYSVVDPADYRDSDIAADIVHIQHQYFIFGGLAPWRNRFRTFLRGVKRPTVMTVHEFVKPEGKPHVRAAIRITNRAQFGSRKVARLLVHTDADKKRMVEEGFGSNRISVVRHGIPMKPPMPDRQEAKEKLGLDGKFVVTLFGFLSRKKGHGVAIESMQHAPSNALLLIAGGPHPDDRSDYSDMLRSLIESSENRERIRITGYLESDEVNRVMAATDLVIAPFTESSGSGSLSLGFACGKAVLASDIPPHRELQSVAPEAILLSRNAPKDLGEAIGQISASTSERERLEQGAAKYAASQSYHQMARETLSVYLDVLKGRSA